jgi:hypothetical protein
VEKGGERRSWVQGLGREGIGVDLAGDCVFHCR